MIKRSKIITLLLVSLTMIIAIAGCARCVSDIQQDDKLDTSTIDHKKTAETSTQQQPELHTYNDYSKLQYFFINGYLLGSYDDDWHSLCDTGNDETGPGDSTTFYAKDLLNQDSYYVYENNKLLGVSKQIIWLTEEAFGLGSFEAEDAPQKFAEYGELYHAEGESGDTAFRIFDLPVKLGDELSKLEIPNYSFHTEFVFGEKWERDYSSYKLVTNSDGNLFPKTLTYGVEPSTEVKQLLMDLFKENNMENTISNFTDCILGDFDNDGNNEYLMVADAPKSELGYPLLCGNGKTDHLGLFNVVFYQDDNGRIQTLYSDLRPYKGVFKADKDNNMQHLGGPGCISIDLLTVADLNADGVYEIGVKKSLWEIGSYLTYAMNNNGDYEVVMCSNIGM